VLRAWSIAIAASVCGLGACASDESANRATGGDGGGGSDGLILGDAAGGGNDGHTSGDAHGPADAAAEAAVPPRGPTPPEPGDNFPFPQNRQSSHCIYPTAYLNSDVQAAYDRWKSDTVTSSGAGGFQRVQRLPSDQGAAPPGSTVSEGIGYGMLVTVYMNDHALFDQLWQYEQLHLDQHGLMNWNISADGTQNLNGGGGATDADEDMAFALVMADHQWGGQGSLAKPYSQYALQQIQTVWANEIYGYMLVIPGDQWPKSGGSVNISYFAPAYYRVFAKLDSGGPGGDDWNAAIASVYGTISAALNAANGNQGNGLVPAWCNSAGVPNASAIGPGSPTNYQYDSCRTPFRIGLDLCWNGQTSAQQYVSLTSAFFAPIGAHNIADGYALDGTPQPAHPGQLSAAFIGPAAVGAMSSSAYQGFVDDSYYAVATLDLLAGGAYYEDSWTILSLLMMTANFLDYTAY
jgi:endo-1,4-beta-D-glucanase Y